MRICLALNIVLATLALVALGLLAVNSIMKGVLM